MDVLFALNMIISFFLISAAKRLCRRQPSTLRVLLGSALGGAYSLAIFLPQVHTAVSLAARLLFMLVLTAAVFGSESAKKYFRCFAALFGVSFLFAGALAAVWFAFKPQGLLIKNGTVYFDIGFLTLVLSAAALYAAVWLGRLVFTPKVNETAECTAQLVFGQSFVTVKGIVDTGNTLTDSFTGKKVSVVDCSTALRLLPFDAAECITQRNFESLPGYMHLTVSETVGGEGLLPVFTADLLAVNLQGKSVEVKNAAVAVSTRSEFDGCGILINSELIGENDFDKETDSKNKAAAFKAKKQGGLLHKRSADLACAAERRTGAADNAANRRRR